MGRADDDTTSAAAALVWDERRPTPAAVHTACSVTALGWEGSAWVAVARRWCASHVAGLLTSDVLLSCLEGRPALSGPGAW